ncbi:hypothetical protein HID58_067650 [Brassica napus]|uniref:Replication factor A C-terminal domain-containing protein n=1 Tax=Brassica napus TaxID=3708 RepID=A0ABQ7ZJA3_BRANA|nr:hypothetical protein HID58_067650 [Brassica napus]
MAAMNLISELKPFKSRQVKDIYLHVLEDYCRGVEKCIIMASIAAIESDMGWYYLSCKVCAKKVLTVPNDTIDDDDEDNVVSHIYYCPKCKTYTPKLLPSVGLAGVLVCSNRLRRSVGFELLRRTRRSYTLSFSLSRRSPLRCVGCPLGSAPPVEVRWDFLAFSVSRRSVFSELLSSLDLSFRLRTSLRSPGIDASSFSLSDDKRWKKDEIISSSSNALPLNDGHEFKE